MCMPVAVPMRAHSTWNTLFPCCADVVDMIEGLASFKGASTRNPPTPTGKNRLKNQSCSVQ